MKASTERLDVYLREHRRFAVLARRYRFMLRDDTHELLAQKAEAAYALAMLEVSELAKQK